MNDFFCQNIDLTLTNRIIFDSKLCKHGILYEEMFDKTKKNNLPTKKHRKNGQFSTFTLTKISIDYEQFNTSNKNLKISPIAKTYLLKKVW